MSQSLSDSRPQAPSAPETSESNPSAAPQSLAQRGNNRSRQPTNQAFRDFIAGLVKEEIEANKLEKK